MTNLPERSDYMMTYLYWSELRRLLACCLAVAWLNSGWVSRGDYYTQSLIGHNNIVLRIIVMKICSTKSGITTNVIYKILLAFDLNTHLC
jgi:hypothetical protein